MTINIYEERKGVVMGDMNMNVRCDDIGEMVGK